MAKKFFWFFFLSVVCVVFGLRAELVIKEVSGKKAEVMKNKRFTIRDKNGRIQTTARDGTVFINEVNYEKGPHRRDRLFRVIGDKKELIRDFKKEWIVYKSEKPGAPDFVHQKTYVMEMAAISKKNLYCLLEEIKGGTPRQLPDGTWEATKIAHVKKYMERWNGKSWEKINLPKLKYRIKMGLTEEGRVYFLTMDFPSQKYQISILDKAKSEILDFPFDFSNEKVISSSVINSNNIWFVVRKIEQIPQARFLGIFKREPKIIKSIFVYHWNGKKLENKGCKGNWADISAVSDGSVFVLDKVGKLFELIEVEKSLEVEKPLGSSSQGLFARIYSWLQEFFGVA
jgi:hypothetical protein